MRSGRSRLLAKAVCGLVAVLCLGLVFAASSLAAVDICDHPVDSAQLSFGVAAGDKADLEGGLGTVEQENYTFDALYSFDNEWSLGVGYRYKILRFDPIEPQTNGHLHTLFVPMHKRSGSDGKNFRFSIAPALSASSNVMKDPKQYDVDALQLLAAAVWGRRLSDQTSLRYGVCGDHRFGSYLIYPTVSFDWQPHNDWNVELGFPSLALRYQPVSSFDSSVRFSPNGNEWYVKDKSLQNESQFIYESYLLEWAFNWRPYRRLAVTASIGRQFRNRYEMTLLDRSRVRISGDDFTRIGAALAWQF